MRRKPRVFQCRLGFLMICMALFALALAPVVSRYHRSWRQQRVISLLESRGARVRMMVGSFTPAVADTCHLRGGSGGHRWTDDDVFLIAQLTTLSELLAHDTQITDKGVSDLVALRKLRTLDLRRTPITDQSAQYLAALPELEILHLDESDVTDRTLEQLRELGKLSWVTLDGTRVTCAGIRRFKAAHQNEGLVVSHDAD